MEKKTDGPINQSSKNVAASDQIESEIATPPDEREARLLSMILIRKKQQAVLLGCQLIFVVFFKNFIFMFSLQRYN